MKNLEEAEALVARARGAHVSCEGRNSSWMSDISNADQIKTSFFVCGELIQAVEKLAQAVRELHEAQQKGKE